jgi:micrococcal nuclease
MTVPGGRGGGAGALALLAILLYLLLAGGSQDSGGRSGTAGDGGAGAGARGVEPDGTVSARVVRVVDGDTIEVSVDGTTDDVRYIGVDTPETVKPGEPVQCYGPQASEFNHELVEGRTVRLEFDAELRDVYGRLLAYVYAGHRFVNAELLRGGFARTLEIEPNTSRAADLAAIEAKAGEAGEGLWSAC